MASVTRTAVKPLQGGVGYELAGGEEWAPEAVTASWDGTSAAGAFVVAVSYYNDGGALIDRAFPEGVTNAPGDTGRTFFRPFKRGGGTSAGGGGIQFDTLPQVGDYLFVHTTGGAPEPSNWGIHFIDDGFGGGIKLESGWEFLLSASHQLELDSSGAIVLNAVSTIFATSTFGGLSVTTASDQDFHTPDGKIELRSDTNTVSAYGGGGAVIGSGANSELYGVTAGVAGIAGAAGVSSTGDDTAAVILTTVRDVILSYYMVGKGGVYTGVPTPGHRFGMDFANGSVFEVGDGVSGATFLRIDCPAGGPPTFHLPVGASWIADL